ncbi:2-hydroxyacyl-CoA dehydratase subunit D [candidate division CSSED10-310 bacterium]|uniref:2-hydroxyacyl-CoA dehydratase subunit D n=1 Tax=candidate division CSSED10-310 bacterium TaxID=2855610 RepID=A0ABV6YRE6_UNCC1
MHLQQYFNQLVHEVGQKIEQKETPRRLLAYEIGRLGQNMFDHRYSVAWTGVFIPFEILQAMGLASFFVEFVGAILAGSGLVGNFVQIAENEGYSTDGCAYHKAVIGASMSGLLPKPDVLIGASIPCDGGLKTMYVLGDLAQQPVYSLQIPYQCSAENISYLVAQFHEMCQHVTRQTGRVLDHDQLRENIQRANESRRLLVELYELSKIVPSPITTSDLKNFAITFALLSGTEAGINVAQAFVSEMKKRSARRTSIQDDEKYRLLWIQNRIQFPNTLLDILSQKYQAKLVIDELNYIYWDELDAHNAFETLAVRLINHPFNGPLHRRLDVLRKLAQDYQIQGVINPAHWGCRQSCGARRLFHQLFDELEIPIIDLDVDCVDDRNFSEGQMLTRLESFMEIIEKRKG